MKGNYDQRDAFGEKNDTMSDKPTKCAKPGCTEIFPYYEGFLTITNEMTCSTAHKRAVDDAYLLHLAGTPTLQVAMENSEETTNA